MTTRYTSNRAVQAVVYRVGTAVKGGDSQDQQSEQFVNKYILITFYHFGSSNDGQGELP